MSALPDYLLKLSVSLGVIALFYHLVLRRLTFYDANRRYLWLYSYLCFIIPVININHYIAPEPTPARVLVQSVPTITRIAAPETATFQPVFPIESSALTTTDWILYIWLAGMLFMTARLLMHVQSYLRIRSQSRLFSNDGVKIFHFDLEMSPFSFGKAIFYNPQLHKPDELQDMILHEYIHVQQWHSLDVIWSEILCIINWFNPFAWLIRSAIRQNLEYIADQKVLENHPDTKAYQYLLLKTAVGPEFSLVNQFGYHSLKQRIVMMNKNASPRVLLACFVFILPLLAVTLAAFRVDQPKPKKRIVTWFASPTNVSKRAPKNILHLAGLLLDAETGKPIPNFQMTLSHYGQFIRSISTDEDGYYFAELPAKPDGDEVDSYEIEAKNGEYPGFASGKSYHAEHGLLGGFDIQYLRKSGVSALGFTHYVADSKPFYDVYDPAHTSSELKSYLIKNLGPSQAEMRLRVEFFKLKPWNKEVITLYKGGYFDQKKLLVGYENETTLYLNGKKATPREINEAFKTYPYLLNNQQVRKMPMFGIANEIAYLTFPLYRDAPPATLVKGNVVIKDVQSFDPARLKNEPYLLDGFRQVYGASSNLIPEKQDVKRVMLLKGALAKYYDPSVKEIWWIETRPVNEVFERPDFASK